MMLKTCLWLILAHMGYPSACCGGKDCHPVPCEEVIRQGNDWVWNGIHFKDELRKESLDGGCHVCIAGNGVPLCIFLGGAV
jgi:hypothetical protein